jgi:protein-S-isoprenylcysteine O-methyltransferase Ste14
MKNKKIIWTGFSFVVVGVIFGVYANMSTFIDSQGVLHENFSTPLSAIFVVLGLLLFVIGLLLFIFNKKK